MKAATTFSIFIILYSTLVFPVFVNAQSGGLAPSCDSKKFKQVAIPEISQQPDTEWCWAAAAQNVMGFHKPEYAPPNTAQCTLVEKVFQMYPDEYPNVLPCCGSNATTDCWAQLGWPEWIFNLEEYHFTYRPPMNTGEILDWTAATKEICQNRPFLAALKFVEGWYHIVVVVGYTTMNGSNEIIAYDPADGHGNYFTVDYDVFVSETVINPKQFYTHFRDTHQIQPPR